MIILKREIHQIETLHFLISHRMTGTPDQLAEKLSISRRQLFNIIAFFRHIGAVISYDSMNSTYYYEEPFEINISPTVNGKIITL